jgi:hypothetical protein
VLNNPNDPESVRKAKQELFTIGVPATVAQSLIGMASDGKSQEQMSQYVKTAMATIGVAAGAWLVKQAVSAAKEAVTNKYDPRSVTTGKKDSEGAYVKRKKR